MFHLSFAQPDDFIHYTSASGLSSNTVYGCMQDQEGFLWFATDAGVSRFDGYTFTNYSTSDGLADNEVFFMHQDHSGRIWFATLNGHISYFYLGRFYNSANTPGLKPLDQSSRISGISEKKDGSILISYLHEGAILYDPANHVVRSHYILDNLLPIIYSSINEKGELLFIGLHELQVFTGNKMVKRLPLKEMPYIGRAFSIGPEKVYISSGSRLFEIDNQFFQIEEIYEGAMTIYNFCRDAGGTQWVCTDEGAIELITNEHLLREEKITFVFGDSEGNTWLGTLTGGLYFSPDYQLKNYTTENGLRSNWIKRLKTDEKGNIWLGQYNGVTRHDPNGQFMHTDLLPHFPKRLFKNDLDVNDLLFDSSRIWLISDNNLVLIYNGEKPQQMDLFEGIGGKRIAKWAGDQIVFSGSSGLHIVPSSKLLDVVTNVDAPRKKYNVLNAFLKGRIYYGRTSVLYRQAEQKVWAGLNNGLLLLVNDTIVEYHKRFTQLEDRVTGIVSNEAGVLFVTTYNSGLYLLHQDTILQVSSQEGLSSNLCTSLGLEDSYTIWVGTNQGVNKVLLDTTYRPKQIVHINTSHGLVSNDVKDLLIHDKQVWVGTSNGLSTFPLDANLENEQPPIIRITEVKAGRETRWPSTDITLTYDQNDLKLSFVGLSYKSQKNIQYKYRLVNGDRQEKTAWRYTDSRNIEFSKLSPGNYAFELAASNSSNQWSEPSVTSLTITPPYWKTAWFQVTGFALMLILILGFILFFIQQASRKEQQKRLVLDAEIKSLKSQMNFHFLSNAFSSMQHFFISYSDLYKHVEQFSQLMRYNLEHAEQDLVPLNEELDYLDLYIATERKRSSLAFEYTLDIHEELNRHEIHIPSLTLQPFVENAIKHGIVPKRAPGKIELRVLPFDEKHYTIEVEDDGVGYRPPVSGKGKRKSHGINLVEERFKVVTDRTGLTFKIQIQNKSRKDEQGTRVIVQIPYLSKN